MWKIWCAALLFFSSLHADTRIIAFAGSSHEGSVNQKLVLEAARIAGDMKANVFVLDLKDYPLPIYNADLEAKEGVPQNAQKLADLMAGSQIALIASPEYNGSITPLIKNTLDWISRIKIKGASPFKGKTFVIMSATPGKGGGKKGLQHLRDILTSLGGQVLPQQLSVSNAYSAFDSEGHLIDPQTQKELQELVQKALSSPRQTRK